MLTEINECFSPVSWQRVRTCQIRHLRQDFQEHNYFSTEVVRTFTKCSGERIRQFPCVFENLTLVISISMVQEAATSSLNKWMLLCGLIVVPPRRWGPTVWAELGIAFPSGWPGPSSQAGGRE